MAFRRGNGPNHYEALTPFTAGSLLLRNRPEGPLARSGDFADITIEDRGNVRLYWGTESQAQDPLLATSGTVHTAYRGQAYLVFDQLFFGRDRTNAPNIEVIVARWPNAPWLPTPNSIEDDVNPVIPLWDLWTNPRYGLGLAETRLDMDALASVGEKLNTEGIGVSPVITRAFNFRPFLVELCECFDAYPTYDSQGRLGLALVRESAAAPVTIEPADLVDAPGSIRRAGRTLSTRLSFGSPTAINGSRKTPSPTGAEGTSRSRRPSFPRR